jgi:hypothetical protein
VYRLFFIQNPPVYITRELQLPLVEFFGGRSALRGITRNYTDRHFSPFSDSKTFDTILDTSKAASFEVVSKKPLTPGQYLITNGIAVYDFAVQ